MAAEPRRFAIDPASVCGWADDCASPAVRSGTVSFEPGRWSSPGQRYVEFTAWLRQSLTNLAPTLVVFEQPAGMRYRSAAAIEVAYGFATRIVEACTERGIEYRGVNASTLKLWSTGRGNAKKPEMQSAAQRLAPWYTAKADPGGHEADALCLLAYAAAGFPPTTPAKRAKRKAAGDPQARLSLTTK